MFEFIQAVVAGWCFYACICGIIEYLEQRRSE
jgi:hypothetical protein